MAGNLIIQLIPAFAIFISMIAFWLSYRNFKQFGHVLGVSYDLIIFMLVVATAAFILHAFTQNALLPDNIYTQALSSGMFALEAILIVIASRVAKKHFDQLFQDKKDDIEERMKTVEKVKAEE